MHSQYFSCTTYCTAFVDSVTKLCLSCAFCRVRHVLLNQPVVENIENEKV